MANIDAILTGLGRLAGALPEARRMIGDVADMGSVGPRVAAIGELVQKAGAKAAKVADDWGWKGGKPGEITGGDIIREIPGGRPMFGPQRDFMDSFILQLRKSNTSGERFNRLLDDYAATQQRAMRHQGKRLTSLVSPSREIAKRFNALEKAGIPREYTGAIERYFGQSDTAATISRNTKRLEKEAKQISDLMRPMTNAQRETFLNILPRWTGALEQAAAAAKKLYRR